MTLVPDARSLDRELLDAASLDPNDLRVNLREMAMLNRLPGGVGESVRATLRELPPRTNIPSDATHAAVADAAATASVPVVLDIGTGSGDYVRRLLDARAVRVIAADIRPEILAIAAGQLRPFPTVTFLEADVRSLPLPDGSVDVCHSSLLLHHLDPASAVVALREMRRVARRAVVVNDLRRSRAAFAMTAATVLAFGRGRYTRHDGVLSARRAYTLPELDSIAADAGLAVVRRSWPHWPRVTTVFR